MMLPCLSRILEDAAGQVQVVGPQVGGLGGLSPAAVRRQGSRGRRSVPGEFTEQPLLVPA
jgi:hypothetical protein